MICYYTGTGNSRYVAQRLAAELHQECVSLLPWLKKGCDRPFPAAEEYTVVSPVYAWRLPRILEQLLPGLQLTAGSTIRFVLTCGDGIGNADRYARRLAEKMGLCYGGTAKVIMPENYIALFEAPADDKAAEITRAAEPVIDAVAEKIRRGEHLSEPVNAVGRLQSSVVNAGFFRFIVSDRKFTSGENCVGCGRCAAVCPLENISLENGRPQWHGSCTHCMACICSCPTKSIEWGSGTASKVRYRFRETFGRSESRNKE